MNWLCPYCNQPTTLTAPNHDDSSHHIDIAAEHLEYKHRVGIHYYAVACPNASCKKLYLMLELRRLNKIGASNYYNEGGVLKTWPLLPESIAKPQPNYIPEAIVQDYAEACRIKDLSPKASATLARRCLQGMIRNFWGVSVESGKLYDEISELENKISTTEWEAIDAVRSVGNIGAHMEKDVNVIVDVEPDEAELLIRLIEDLFKDWYVTRHDREQRQLKLKELAEQKKEARKKKDKAAEK